jgi:hypothetical protein
MNNQEENRVMKKASIKLILCVICLTVSACGPGVEEGDYGTSKLGESCSSRADCIKGLTCVNLACVLDESTSRSCGEIEEIFLGSVVAENASYCEDKDDCYTLYPFCNLDNPAAEDQYYLNRSIDLTGLEDEWEANGCDGGYRCSGYTGSMGSLECIDNKCSWQSL